MAGLFGEINDNPQDTQREEPAKARQRAFDRVLTQAYERVGRTLDDLAYTDEFERVFADVLQWERSQPQGTLKDTPASNRASVFRRLHNLRKANKLPRLGRASTPAVKVTPEDEASLEAMVVEACGSLGQRDQLLYDDRFHGILASFNARTGRTLTPHDLWRLVAKIAK